MKKAFLISLSTVLVLGAVSIPMFKNAPRSPAVLPASSELKPITKYSLSTTLNGSDCFLDRLDELKKDGITHMEIFISEKYEEQAPLFADAVKKIKDAGLEVWSIHLPYGDSVSPAAMTEAKRQENIIKIKKFIGLTESAGAKTYVIHASFEPIADADRQIMLDSTIKSLAELNTYTAEKGISLALENLPRTCIANSIEEVKIITNAIPDLKLCFDTNHFTTPHPNYILRPLQRVSSSMRNKANPAVETPGEYAKQFADKIITVHVSDYDQVDECHWMPGQGLIDFQSIHNAITNAGFRAPITFEPYEICRGVKTTGERLITSYEEAIGLK